MGSGVEFKCRHQLSGLRGKRFCLLSHLISPSVDQAGLTLVILLPLYLQHTVLENAATANHPLLTHLSQYAARSVSSPRGALDPCLPVLPACLLSHLPVCLPACPPTCLPFLPSFFKFCFLCMNALPACMSVPYAYLVPTEPLRGQPVPGSGVIDNCESRCGCWEVNLGHLKEQPVLWPFLTSFSLSFFLSPPAPL